MLVDHLLLAHGVDDNREVIKAAYISLDLEAIDEMNRHGDILLTHLIQETILKLLSDYQKKRNREQSR